MTEFDRHLAGKQYRDLLRKYNAMEAELRQVYDDIMKLLRDPDLSKYQDLLQKFNNTEVELMEIFTTLVKLKRDADLPDPLPGEMTDEGSD